MYNLRTGSLQSMESCSSLKWRAKDRDPVGSYNPRISLTFFTATGSLNMLRTSIVWYKYRLLGCAWPSDSMWVGNGLVKYFASTPQCWTWKWLYSVGSPKLVNDRIFFLFSLLHIVQLEYFLLIVTLNRKGCKFQHPFRFIKLKARWIVLNFSSTYRQLNAGGIHPHTPSAEVVGGGGGTSLIMY